MKYLVDVVYHIRGTHRVVNPPFKKLQPGDILEVNNMDFTTDTYMVMPAKGISNPCFTCCLCNTNNCVRWMHKHPNAYTCLLTYRNRVLDKFFINVDDMLEGL